MAKRREGVITQSLGAGTYPPELPVFASEEAAADFFDTHSMAPYLDQMEEITDDVTVSLRPGNQGRHAGRLALRLPDSLLRELEQAANQYGVTPSEMAVTLIARGLSQGSDAAADGR